MIRKVEKISRGILLLAEPMLLDPNFKRRVVVLCEHQNEEGTFGLVLNHPVPLKLTDVMADEVLPDKDLYLGGPVQPETLHILHRAGEKVEGALHIKDNLYMGGDFDHIRSLFMTGELSESDFRFFLGYAGWGEGQLQSEIDSGGWIMIDTQTDYIFNPDIDRLWTQILKDMGGEYALLANFPDDPRMN